MEKYTFAENVLFYADATINKNNSAIDVCIMAGCSIVP